MGSGNWRTHFIAAIVVAAVSSAATVVHAAQDDWTLVDIGTLGGPGSYGAAVSDSGVVVGCSDVKSGGAHAFVYRSGVIQDLGTASDSPAGSSCALAVNNDGTIAGRSSTGELVIWKEDSVIRLGVKGNIGGINKAGVVVGTYVDGTTNRAFMLRNGVLTDLGALGANAADPNASSSANAINARNQVAGVSNGRAFLYEGGAMRDLGTLGGNSSVARGINSRGEIVGMSTDSFGSPTPFIYHGKMQALPGTSYSTAIAINNRGQIVGSGEGIYGFLMEGEEVTRLDRLPAVVAQGWRHLEPTGINERGWIVGTAVNPEGNLRAFLLVPANEEHSKPVRFWTGSLAPDQGR
jgi:probable HAF family extracellular repeat protein